MKQKSKKDPIKNERRNSIIFQKLDIPILKKTARKIGETKEWTRYVDGSCVKKKSLEIGAVERNFVQKVIAVEQVKSRGCTVYDLHVVLIQKLLWIFVFNSVDSVLTGFWRWSCRGRPFIQTAVFVREDAKSPTEAFQYFSETFSVAKSGHEIFMISCFTQRTFNTRETQSPSKYDYEENRAVIVPDEPDFFTSHKMNDR